MSEHVLGLVFECLMGLVTTRSCINRPSAQLHALARIVDSEANYLSKDVDQSELICVFVVRI